MVRRHEHGRCLEISAPEEACSQALLIGDPMMDNTAIRDEIFGPPFMHTALKVTLMLNYRLNSIPPQP